MIQIYENQKKKSTLYRCGQDLFCKTNLPLSGC